MSTQQQPMLGRFCRWCGAPATTEIEIEPTQYREVVKRHSVTGERLKAQQVSRQAITADVCAVHEGVRDKEGGELTPDMRKRGAKNVVQLDIFGNEIIAGRGRKPDNAIRGLQ